MGPRVAALGCTVLASCSLLTDVDMLDERRGLPVTGNVVDAGAEAGTDGGQGPTVSGCEGASLFCDDFDAPTSPSARWVRKNGVRDASIRVDPGASRSAPNSVAFYSPPVDQEPGPSLTANLDGEAAKRVRLSFDVRVEQSTGTAAIALIGPYPYPADLLSKKYFISIRVDDNQFAYNAGAKPNNGPDDDLYQPFGGDPRKWSHFDIDYDATGVAIAVRLDGELKVTDTLPVLPSTGTTIDIGLLDLKTTDAPWLVRYDNVSVNPR